MIARFHGLRGDEDPAGRMRSENVLAEGMAVHRCQQIRKLLNQMRDVPIFRLRHCRRPAIGIAAHLSRRTGVAPKRAVVTVVIDATVVERSRQAQHRRSGILSAILSPHREIVMRKIDPVWIHRRDDENLQTFDDGVDRLHLQIRGTGAESAQQLLGEFDRRDRWDPLTGMCARDEQQARLGSHAGCRVDAEEFHRRRTGQRWLCAVVARGRVRQVFPGRQRRELSVERGEAAEDARRIEILVHEARLQTFSFERGARGLALDHLGLDVPGLRQDRRSHFDLETHPAEHADFPAVQDHHGDAVPHQHMVRREPPIRAHRTEPRQCSSYTATSHRRYSI